MAYNEALENIKTIYPFERWRASFFSEDDDIGGLEQYTQENCDTVKSVFDNLISELCTIGEDAPKQNKVALFKIAVESLNKINEEIDDLIETGEREDLCELIDQITIAAKLNPDDYGDGEGIADEWRKW